MVSQKSLLWMLFCGSFCWHVSAYGDEPRTADEVIERYIEALGGRERLDARKSVRVTGKITLAGETVGEFQREYKRAGRYRKELAMFQGTTVFGLDGHTPWFLVPFHGADAQPVHGVLARYIAAEADIDGPLVDFRKKGHQVELVGKEECRQLGNVEESGMLHLGIDQRRKKARPFSLNGRTVMERNVRRTILRGVLCGWAVVAGIRVPAANTAEHLGLEEIRSGLKRQQEEIASLHIRVRRKTTISVERDVLLGWQHEIPPPEYLGTDEVLFAVKGDKRYHRVVALDYAPKTPKWLLPYIGRVKLYTIDEAAACSAGTVWQRKRALESFGVERPFRYRSAPAEEAPDSLPPPDYLMNVGLALPDPTGRDEAKRNLQQLGLLSELLERWPYVVSGERDQVDGVPCVVLEGQMECRLPGGNGSQKRDVRDKLWLDPEHGLALRKRETWVGGQLCRVLNSDMEEILPGFWLPRRSRTETFAPPAAPKQYRDRPAWVRDMTLCLWVVNQTPDDLFDTALTKPKPVPPGGKHYGLRHGVPPLDLVPAYHQRVDFFRWDEAAGKSSEEVVGVREIWAVRGVGWRREYRSGSTLRSLDVDTGRWAFSWRKPADNRVTAVPSAGDRVPTASWGVGDRARLIRESEELTGVFACQKDRLAGKEVDKLTVHYPAERQAKGRWNNIHSFRPEVQLAASGTEFCRREHWFDPKTQLRLRFRCGCKAPGCRVTLDYPPPESVPRDLFTFEVPLDARLEVRDPELGRDAIHSEGQREPDSRP